MPGRPRQDHGSSDLINDHATGITRTPTFAKSTFAKSASLSPRTMANGVQFIPPQMDAHAGSTDKALRDSPVVGLFRDVGVLVTMLRQLPSIVSPFQTTDKTAELYPWSWLNMRDAILQSLLMVIEASMVLLAPVALFVSMFLFPGGLLVAMIALSYAVIYIISLPMQGPRVVNEQPKMGPNPRPDERWLFINGCVTGHVGLQQSVNRLSKTFGRPVIGIHNQSFGLFADLIECLIQRCLSYNTQDTRMAYEYVKSYLSDPNVNKVVLIGHSQGGIIVSMVVDRLLADLPIETVSKLEIYTFGSAASHFNNPRLTLQPKASPEGNDVNFSNPTSENVIPHIEHYCNEHDMVPSWGVMYSVQKLLDRRYSGKVFVRKGASGHMFNQHYLDPMFPLDGLETDGFQAQVVDVDEATAKRRESAAMAQKRKMRTDSGLSADGDVEFGDGQIMPVGLIVNGESKADPCISFVESNVHSAATARGKTVKELSRLWRYIDGKTPTPSAGDVNGISGAAATRAGP